MNAEERVGVVRRFRNLQESSWVKRPKAPECIFEAVGLAVKLIDVMLVLLPVMVDVADPRT